MADFRHPSRILITCPKGLAPFLGEEVRALGMPPIAERSAGIETEGTLADTMRLNLHLRTAHRVLFLLRELRVREAGGLYAELSKLPWEDLIPCDGYLSVDSAVSTESIRDSRFATLTCKDAIVDRIRAACGRRPDSGPAGNGAAVFLYWRGSQCAVYLNTSGEPLARRGYRKIPLQAPMQETLAAAVVTATGWNGSGHFVNPMCGSGTLAIEAALIGLNKAPGLLRGNYGFMHLKGFQASAWDALRRQARAAARRTLPAKILATDHSPKAVAATQRNARTAGVEHLIECAVCDFADTPIPDGGGVVVLNPEYGQRMGEVNELAAVYERIGDFFKQRCLGYKGYIFTGNLQLAKRVGLRTKRRVPFFNSQIECRLLEYELYPGTRRAKA